MEVETSVRLPPLFAHLGKINYQIALVKIGKVVDMHSTLFSTGQTSIGIILDSISTRWVDQRIFQFYLYYRNQNILQYNNAY